MLSVKTKGNFRTIINNLESHKANIEGKTDFFEQLALLLNSSIQIRVQKDGKGINGQKLSEYTKKYADWKSSKGRNTKYRDLTFSGNMWQALSAENIVGGARMYFKSAAETNKARGNEARTPFFGISQKEKNIIKREVAKMLNGGK